MADYYTLNGREVVPASYGEYSRQHMERIMAGTKVPPSDPWRVAYTDIGPCYVSTVFLGMDHSWSDGPPELFETMIFGDEHSEDQWRYATYDEAEAGHKAIVEALKSGGKLPGYEEED